MLFWAPRKTITRGLIAWYRFGDGITNALDYSGHPGQMAANNGSAIPQFAGPIGPAFKFPGAGRFTAGANVGSLTGVSALCWLNPAVSTRGDCVTQWASGGTASDQFNLLYATTHPAQAQFFISTGSSTVDSGPSNVTMTLGKWTHIAGTYDGANVRIFTNGTLSNFAASSVAMGTGAGPISIGNNRNGDGQLTGSLADVRVYNRALSAAEIFSIYSEPFHLDAYAPGRSSAVSAIIFRKTLSQIGGRVGSRQIQGWAA